MNVKLLPHEIEMAAQVGIRRRLESLNFTDRYGYLGKDAWEQDIQAAAGELAVAKCLGLYWDGSVNTLKRGDVGRLQVRSTSLPNGSLIVREGDTGDDLFVLVIGSIPFFRVVGSMYARDAKSDTFRRAPNGRPAAYFVPQSALTPCSDGLRP